jgi:2-methylcitrate dehydratase PrpD
MERTHASLTRDLVEHLLELDRDDLTPDVLDSTRALLFDFIGVAANGASTASAQAMQAFVTALDDGHAPIIGTSLTTSPLRAAMANGVAAHAIEYDDTHNASSSHPGSVIIPAAMAAASMSEADAGSFLLGVVVGYEAMGRIGRAAGPASHYARHFHPTGTIGHFGAAAAAASILGLDPEQTASAFGIAGSMAAGSMQFILEGAWTKRLHPAHAARDGVEAALLAQSGYLGPHDAIAGERGFLAGYCESPDPKELLAEWGDRDLEIQNTSIKAHTCCRYMQGPIDALLDIRAEHNIDPDEIESIVVGLLSVAEDIVAEPVEKKRRPQNVVDAQFSMPFGAAVAMRFGRVSLPEFDEAVFKDPEIGRLMDITQCVVDPDLDLAYPVQWRAWSEVTTVDGRSYRASVDDPKGDPANPFSSDELRAKFDMLTAGCYSEVRRERLAVAALGLGAKSELEDLFALLGTDLT